MPRTCKQCGHEGDPRQNFCGSCGAAVQADSSSADPYIGRVLAGKFRLEDVIGTGSYLEPSRTA